MTADPGTVMAAAAALVLVAVLASKASARLGVPALLLFLAIGMVAGSEGIGGIDFADHEAARAVGVVALAFILFSGGLDTEWRSVRPVLGVGMTLATVGVLVTALVVGVVASWVLDVSLTAGLLLGAIVSSTDAAAVFAVLRSQRVGLAGRLRPLLELESGSNDPMAVFLTVGFLELLANPGTDALTLVPWFVLQMGVGAVVGLAMARVSVLAVNRLRLEYDGLYPVVLIAVVLATFGVADLLGGSGFLAVYLAGIMLGNASFIHKRSLVRFADGLAWMMQIAMFLVLGLLVFPSDLGPVAGRALLIALVLVFVARPVATTLVLALARFGVRPTLFVAWVGLRGAAPIILATFPLVEGIPQAETIFNVVFFIVITSVLVQGTSVARVARMLRVDAPVPRRTVAAIDLVESGSPTTTLHELVVGPAAPAAGQRVMDLGLPGGALVVLVTRADERVVPQGSTVLQPGDGLLLLADPLAFERARPVIEGPGPAA